MKIRTDAVSIIHIVVVQVTSRIDIELISVVVVEVIRRARPTYTAQGGPTKRPEINTTLS